MYADRHYRPEGAKPLSLTVSLAITGAMVAGMMFANPNIVQPPPETHLVIRDIPIPPPPKPEPQKPQPKLERRPDLVEPTPQVPLPRPDETIVITRPDPIPTPATTGMGEPTPIPTLSPPPPAAVLTDVQLDPRYADALQPGYPAEERRAEREGRVTVRVLVGVDGRVKQVVRVNATTDAFFAATERQALRSWRFKPATRDGIPVEGWRTMAIRFELHDE